MEKFRLFVSYSQAAVFDPSLEKPLNNWTPQHVAQGFSWRPGSVSFKTLSESDEYEVELIVDNAATSISTAAVRVIEVPFEVPTSAAIEVGSIGEGRRFSLTPGQYGLRFEELPGSAIRLVFSRGKSRFAVLRADLNLKPILPLVTTAEPA